MFMQVSGAADVTLARIVSFDNDASLYQPIDYPMDRRAQAAALEPVKFRPLRHVPDQGRRSTDPPSKTSECPESRSRPAG